MKKVVDIFPQMCDTSYMMKDKITQMYTLLREKHGCLRFDYAAEQGTFAAVYYIVDYGKVAIVTNCEDELADFSVSFVPLHDKDQFGAGYEPIITIYKEVMENQTPERLVEMVESLVFDYEGSLK